MSQEAVPLRSAARELAEVALTLREASVHATAALADPALLAGTVRAPLAGLRAQRALLRAITDRRGLGWAAAGGPLGVVGARVGGMVGARSLALRVMMTSLRLRIAAVLLQNPDLAADPLLARLTEAVEMGREVGSARALHALIKDRGTVRALSGIAPIFGEILALRALLDHNPLNDHTAWLIAGGTGTATADPLTGFSNRAIAALDRGDGAAHPAEFAPDEEERLRRTGSLLDFLTNISVLGPTGRVLIQTVQGPDGAERHVVLAPGMRMGRPDHDSPADLLGAFSATVQASGPYSRSLAHAVAEIPPGADVALIGHSAGGAAVLSLAEDPDFCARYNLTHIVVVGSPVDYKRPASAATWTASVTNQRDIIPTLDGQGAGTCFELHPDWYVVDYTDPAHLFPACHSIEHYTANLADDLPAERAEIDRNLRPYHGPVVAARLYQLYDRAPRGASREGNADDRPDRAPRPDPVGRRRRPRRLRRPAA